MGENCLEVTKSRQVNEGTTAEIELILWPPLPGAGGRKKDAFQSQVVISCDNAQPKW